MKYVNLLIGTMLLATLFACGGGGSNGNDDDVVIDDPIVEEPVSGDISAVNGIWRGVLDDDAELLVLNQDGRIVAVRYNVDSTVDLFEGEYTVDVGDVTLSGTISSYENHVGWPPVTIRVDTKDLSLDGTLDDVDGLLTLVVDGNVITLEYESSSDWAISQDMISGPYESATSHIPFVVHDDGRFDGQDATGCTVNGNILSVDDQRNMFDITYQYASCGDIDGTYAGLAIADEMLPNGVVFAIMQKTEGLDANDLMVFDIFIEPTK